MGNKLSRYNFWLILSDGALFQSGTFFMGTATVIPLFINTMTGSKTLLGLILTLAGIFNYCFQLVAGPYVHLLKNRVAHNAVIALVTRPLILIPAICLLMGINTGTVLMVSVAFVLIWVGEGLIMPGWLEYMSDTIPNESRGRLMGLQQMIGGISGILSSFIVNTLFNKSGATPEQAFGRIFLIAGCIYTLSGLAVRFTRDIPRKKPEGKVSYKAFYGNLPGVLRAEKDFRRMLKTYVALLLAAMCNPYIILTAQETMSLDISWIITAQAFGLPAGGLLWGQISHRFGPHMVIKLVTLSTTLVSTLTLLALLFGVFPLTLCMSAIFLAGISNGLWVGVFSYVAGSVKQESRSSCMILMSAFCLPCSFASYLAGGIVYVFGYKALFIICLCLGITAIISSRNIRSLEQIAAKQEADITAAANGRHMQARILSP